MAITRVWQGGLEEGSIGVFGVTSGLQITTTSKTGTYAMVNDLYYGNGYGDILIPNTRQVRVGQFTRWDHTNTRNVYNRVLTLRSGSSELVSVRIDFPSQYIQLWVGGASVDTANYPVSSGEWHHIGLDVKIDSSSGWGKVYVDGVEQLSTSGNTGNADIVKFRVGLEIVDWGGYVHTDDVYLDDTTGEGSAAVCPILRFYPLTMDGNGNYAQWDGSDGNSTDNYLLVDERPPNDWTDYVQTTVTDEYDSYTMTGITLGTGQTVNAVIPTAYAIRTGSTEQIALGTRLSGTDSIGSDQTPELSWIFLSERQTTKPGGGSWSESDVNGAELVIKSRGTY